MEVHAGDTFEHVSAGVYRLKYKGNRNNLTSIDLLFDKVESWSDKTPLAVQVRGFNKNAVWRSINALPGYVFIIAEQGEDEYITVSFYEKCDIKDISTGKLVDMGVGVVSLVRRGQTVVFCAIKLSTKGAMAETREERRVRMAQTRQLLEPFLQSVPLSSLYELNRDPLNRYAKLLAPNRVRELEKYPSLFVPINKSASSLLVTLERHKRLSPDQILADIHRAIVENPDLVQTIVDRISLGDYRELVTIAILRHDVALLDALLQDASPET